MLPATRISEPANVDFRVFCFRIVRLPTISFRWLPLCYLAFLFEIDIPAVRLPFFVLECEREDGIALLHGVFSLGGV